MSVTRLRKFILEEAAKVNETLEQGKADVESVNADETDAEDLANTLEKDLDHMKALKIHETRIRRKLEKISEAKKTVRSRIMKRLK
ncbi:MAG: hypothetical protein CMA72_09365 [Euryarchaeota archaeon]|nr:hypothetical protein [Euryarchaeota archaeon]